MPSTSDLTLLVKLDEVASAILAAVMEEREACAQIAANWRGGPLDDPIIYHYFREKIAAAIRARGEAPP